MKRVYTILAIILLVIVAGCGEHKQAINDGLITLDVTNSFSQKKELILQDFMDVEYIALETNKEFVNHGWVQDIGKELIIVKNRTRDGNIFVYDRTGKALRKINRMGQGGEEYINLFHITLDEDNGEMFVNDISTKKIYVYDLFGNFKRSFSHKTGSGSMFYTEVYNYDNDNLICYDSYNEEIVFILVSKQDGSITKEIKVPFKEKKQLMVMNVDKTLAAGSGPFRPIIPHKGNLILSEFSSDTIYTLLPDHSLRPFMVRTPSIQSMDPEVMVKIRLMSDRYYFMETVENKYNFDTNAGFDAKYLIYDTQEKAFGGYIAYNGDYSTKKEIYMSSFRPVNHEIDLCLSIDAHLLVESYKNGELKDGKLKEIAAELDEEDNPVIMLVKHKNAK